VLDAFRPDAAVIWGDDDQHENFVDDVIPPFCVLGKMDEDLLRTA
jgi:hypothetical protein